LGWADLSSVGYVIALVDIWPSLRMSSGRPKRRTGEGGR